MNQAHQAQLELDLSLWIKLSFEEKVKIKTISALDQNSNMPFLRNEFLEIFEDLFTIAWFSKMKIIYDQTQN